METYTVMRQFADSWGLLVMFLFFIGANAFVFLRPYGRQVADNAAAIPFKED
jgi:cytochrome c oxidase cbb3-type subunit IV